jgi:hypothetical protein
MNLSIERIEKEVRKSQKQIGQSEALLLSRTYLQAGNYKTLMTFIKIMKDIWVLNPAKKYLIGEVRELIMDDVTGNLETEEAKIKILQKERNKEYIN